MLRAAARSAALTPLERPLVVHIHLGRARRDRPLAHRALELDHAHRRRAQLLQPPLLVGGGGRRRLRVRRRAHAQLR
eukprot:2323209-Prymnesium_polylepis.1